MRNELEHNYDLHDHWILRPIFDCFSLGANAQTPQQVNKVKERIRSVWAPLNQSSPIHQFVKSQLNQKLAEKGLKLLDDSLVVKADLATEPLNIVRSTVNLEYQWFPNLKDYTVTFAAMDDHEQKVTGSTYLAQVNCQEVVDDIHKKVVDCDAPDMDKNFGVIGGKSEGRILVGLVNEPMAVQLPKVLDLNLH